MATLTDSLKIFCSRFLGHRAAGPHGGPRLSAGLYGKLARHRTTGLFRSSQWGSATIPYKGAKVNVPVLSGNKKVSSVGSSRSRVVLQNLTVGQLVEECPVLCGP